MANAVLNPSIIAAEAIDILNNNLVTANLMHRAHEDEFDKKVNGYKVGSTITIRKPAQFTVRSGAVASSQDVVEGSTTIVVDQQKGVDFEFTSTELTLSIGELSERVIKPAMVRLANQIDTDCQSMYKNVWNWVGTPGQTVNAFTDFALGPQRLDEMSVPTDERNGTLAPADWWAMAGALSNLAAQTATAETALRKARLGMLGNVATYMSQNVPVHTVGLKGGTPLINGAAQQTTYALSKTTNTQSLITDGWTVSVNAMKAGDVFTIANVFAVNPVTKQVLPYLQQFVNTADVSADGSGNATFTISPAMILTGAYQNISAAPADNAAIAVLGTASTNYNQNMIFHKNAFALAVVPMEVPQGAINVSRKSMNGLNVRVVPFYDGTNDISKWRLDVLYGFKAINPGFATRLSGTA
jgi:hypothetical protein